MTSPIYTIKRYADMVNATESLNKYMNKEISYEKLGEEVVKQLLILTDSEYGYIDEIRITEQGKEYLHCIGISDLSWDDETRDYYMKNKPVGFDFYNCNETTMYGLSLIENKKGNVFFAKDVETDNRRGGTPKYPKGHPPLHALMVLGVYINGKLIGQLAVANNPNGYSSDLGVFLTPYANICGMILQYYKTRLKEISNQRKLLESKQQIEQALQVKSKFLSNMSHEVRTPMNGILGMIQLLKDSELNKEQQEYITICNKNATGLLSILDDILLYSRTERGVLKPMLSIGNLANVLYDMINMYKFVAKDIDLIPLFDEKIFNDYTLDLGRFRQIMTNLLGNALKFTHKGHIILQAEHIKQISNDHLIKISIIDTGIGIKEEDMKKIFQPFTRLNVENDSKYEGTGLGLAICKELITTIFNGQIKCESEFKKGTKFSMEFTLTGIPSKENQLQVQAKIKSIIENTLQKLKIIIIDDNEMSLYLLRKLFSLYCYEVECISTPKDLIEKIRQKQYDLILTDYRMPLLNGLELAQELREKYNYKNKIVILSSIIDKSIVTANNGIIDDYIWKPIYKDELFGTILKIFN